MRIVIDMQGAQSTGSRGRGIGRYTMAIVKAIVQNRGEHEIILALNSQFPEAIESIRKSFKNLLPQENIRVWYSPVQVNHMNRENDWQRTAAELIREAFLANLKPDIVLISSLFEGLVDDAVTSIGKFSSNSLVAVILYDLIPFIHRKHYLENPVVERWYENKLEHLKRAELLLAISESSRQEALVYLNFPEEKTVNISTAADDHFKPQSFTEREVNTLLQSYGLVRPYIMYTGGIDHRKNIEGLIKAYSKLDQSLRMDHQLAVVCSITPTDRERLNNLAKESGLLPNEVIFTGFVPEEDLVALYNLSKAFVFPSWHEGFGLPALEAMSCGKAVIASNISSLPEVVGREDALFNPYDIQEIVKKLTHILTDNSYRHELEKHGLIQANKFSWDKSAKTAIAALEALFKEKNRQPIKAIQSSRPKLAYISPLPPERSGISDYSKELLPELSRYYDIDVIVSQDEVCNHWITQNCPIRSVEWFREHSEKYERVLYHFGNSAFHQHMFKLLEEIPGVVVLHDFYLSGVISYMDALGFTPDGFVKELYYSHGYQAVQNYYSASDRSEAIWKYPCNLKVLQNAQGIIVHSDNSRRLAKHWYGVNVANDWTVIPHLRVPASTIDRSAARRSLGIGEDDFVVCSFGLLGRTKLNHRLLETWLKSSLAKDKKCVLVFAGENDRGEYGLALQNTIRSSGMGERIRITGWLDTDTFRQYLAAADVGVQLRTLSRGETSGTVLDCMNYGLPTIVNSNGSMADLPSEGIWKLPDEFSNNELQEALETLWRDKLLREKLGKEAQKIILSKHAPHTCAKKYHEAIERIYRESVNGLQELIYKIAHLESTPDDSAKLQYLSTCIAQSLPPKVTPRQLLVDISDVVQCDVKPETHEIVLSVLRVWLSQPPNGWRIEPVYVTQGSCYRYARSFTTDLLGCPNEILIDEPVEYYPGDVFIGLDIQQQVISARNEFCQEMRRFGVSVYYVGFDLLTKDLPKKIIRNKVEGS